MLYSILNANVNVHNIQSQMISYESELDAKTKKPILWNEMAWKYNFIFADENTEK